MNHSALCAPLRATIERCRRPCSSVASASALASERSAGGRCRGDGVEGTIERRVLPPLPVSSGAEAEVTLVRRVRAHPPVSGPVRLGADAHSGVLLNRSSLPF